MASCSQYTTLNPFPASVHVVVGAKIIQPARRDRRDCSADGTYMYLGCGTVDSAV